MKYEVSLRLNLVACKDNSQKKKVYFAITTAAGRQMPLRFCRCRAAMTHVKVHRHVKSSSVVSALVALLIAACYFFVAYRTEHLLKLFVENQWQGEFLMETGKIEISFLHHRIGLENATIRQVDLKTGEVKSTLTLPKLHLQLSSWSKLALKKQLVIDSAMLVEPALAASLVSGMQATSLSFRAAEIIKALNRAADQLNVRTLKIREGRILLSASDTAAFYEIKHINISIENFGRNDQMRLGLPPAGNLVLDIGAQQIRVGELVMKFQHLHFSARFQALAVDSIEFTSGSDTAPSRVIGNIARMRLASDSLLLFFESGVLVLDTLNVMHPVIAVQLNDRLAAGTNQSAVNETLMSLFPDVRIKHLLVSEGEFLAESHRDGRTLTYTTQRTDLQIGNLALYPGEDRFLTVGDIGMQLRKITFYTPDSSYQLKVEKFDLSDTEIGFRDAVFSPSHTDQRSLCFTAVIPLLSLHRFRLEDLLEGRLGAERALMDAPAITVEVGERRDDASLKKRKQQGFYNALHGLSQILQVNMLEINHGAITFHSASADSLIVTGRDLNSRIRFDRLLTSNSPGQIENSFEFLEMGELEVKSEKLHALITNFHTQTEEKEAGVESVHISTQSTSLKADVLNWSGFSTDSLLLASRLLANSVHAGKISIDLTQKHQRESNTPKTLPFLQISRVSADKFNVHYRSQESDELAAKGKEFELENLSAVGGAFSWSKAKGEFTSLKFTSENFTASADKVKVHLPGASKLKDVTLHWDNDASLLEAKVPEIMMETDAASVDESLLHFKLLSLEDPRISLMVDQASFGKSVSSMPFPAATLEQLRIAGGSMNVEWRQDGDTVFLSSGFGLSSDSFEVNPHKDASLRFGVAVLSLQDFSFSTQHTSGTSDTAGFTFHDGRLSGKPGSKVFEARAAGGWSGTSVTVPIGHNAQLEVKALDGAVYDGPLQIEKGKKQTWSSWVNRVELTKAGILYRDSLRTFASSNVAWQPLSKSLLLDSVRFRQNVSEEEFFQRTPWQSDYIEGNADGAYITGLDPALWESDSILWIHRIDLVKAQLRVVRDKRLPFLYGMEKPMPTLLTNSIPFRFRTDSMVFQNSTVTYVEHSGLTNRTGTVPIENINATLKNFGNYHPSAHDTLALKGRGKLLNSHISKFSYKEAYGDTLATFSLTVKISPSELSEFSGITDPLAAVEITSGNFDTLLARISGNKYAAVGSMQFDFHNLKIRLQNPEDTLAKRLGLSFVNFVANSFVVKSENHKTSAIFFLRDRERFVFNFWMKSILSGILTSAGIRSNGKYEKQYKKMKRQYPLPSADF